MIKVKAKKPHLLRLFLCLIAVALLINSLRPWQHSSGLIDDLCAPSGNAQSRTILFADIGLPELDLVKINHCDSCSSGSGLALISLNLPSHSFFTHFISLNFLFVLQLVRYFQWFKPPAQAPPSL